MCKRSMFILANEIRKYLKADGVITGSSIGQVASQTSKNISSEIYGLSIPIYHPLIGFDKEEITNMAKFIGTYTISTRKMNDVDCKAVPNKPEIGSKENILLLEEKEIGNEIINDIRNYILNSKKFITIKN